MVTERADRWLGFFAAALLVGCAATAGHRESISIADLDGTEWRLISLDGADPGGEMTMRFEGTKVTGKGGCNRFFGTVEDAAVAGALSFGPLGATRMSCGDALDSAENRYFTALDAVTRCAMDAGRLVLGGDAAGELLFERVAGPSE